MKKKVIGKRLAPSRIKTGQVLDKSKSVGGLSKTSSSPYTLSFGLKKFPGRRTSLTKANLFGTLDSASSINLSMSNAKHRTTGSFPD